MFKATKAQKTSARASQGAFRYQIDRTSERVLPRSWWSLWQETPSQKGPECSCEADLKVCWLKAASDLVASCSFQPMAVFRVVVVRDPVRAHEVLQISNSVDKGWYIDGFEGWHESSSRGFHLQPFCRSGLLAPSRLQVSNFNLAPSRSIIFHIRVSPCSARTFWPIPS